MKQFKSLFLILLLVTCLLIQFSLFQSFQLVVVFPNIVLSLIVVIGLYADYEQVLWLSLISGVSNDLYSSLGVGFNIVFYIVIGLLCKVVYKKIPVDRRLLVASALIVIISGLQATAIMLSVFTEVKFFTAAQNVLLYVILTSITAVAWFGIFNYLSSHSRKLNLIKVVTK